jgi:cytolysin (calcineurin-like family phosphatase)
MNSRAVLIAANPPKRKLFLVSILFSILFLSSPALFARDITFLHISDQHYGAKNFDQNIPQATIDAMNAIAGVKYPDNLTGLVAKPFGLILTGDLTDSGLAEQWQKFASDWGLIGSDGRLKYPLYEGAGNHDGQVSSADGARGYVRRQLIERNKKRPNVVNTSDNGPHYSWDWEDVHFVQLNEYASLDDVNRYGGNPGYKRKSQSYGNPAQKSLQFLEKDLAEKVGKSGRPVILCQHYGFDDFSFHPWGDEKAWWTEEHALRLWETIESYNVIAILSGHDGSEAIYNWNGINNYHMDDNIRFGVYHITDSNMTVSKRNSRTNEWESSRSQSTTINAGSPNLLKAGPYLIYPDDPTKMTICWQSDSDKAAELAWGNVFFNYEAGKVNVSPFDAVNHLYKYTITGLKPNTRYSYAVKYNGKYSPGLFYTAPESNSVKVKFLVYDDAQNSTAENGKINKVVYDKIYQDAAYHTFLLYDLAGAKSENNINYWDNQFFSRSPEAKFARFVQTRLPIMGIISSGGEALYKKLFPYPYQNGRFYSFDYGPVHTAVLDPSLSYAPGSEQYKWLEKDLASTTRTWKIILMGEPGKNVEVNRIMKNTEKFIQPLRDKFGVDLFLARQNLYYVEKQTGSNGKEIKSGHLGAVEITGDTLNFEIFDDSGKLVDSFKMQDFKGNQEKALIR